jgi:hypothetical protein
MPALAGQALNTWTPRGVGNVVAGGTGISAVGGLLSYPQAIALLTAQSPRLVGETAHLMGRAGRYGAMPVNAIGQVIDPATLANILALTGQINEKDRLNPAR